MSVNIVEKMDFFSNAFFVWNVVVVVLRSRCFSVSYGPSYQCIVVLFINVTSVIIYLALTVIKQYP